MPTLLQKFDRFGIAFTLMLATILSMANLLGCFRFVDDWLVDQWQRLGSAPSDQSILLVSTPGLGESGDGNAEITGLISTLEGLGAETIAITRPIELPFSAPDRSVGRARVVVAAKSEHTALDARARTQAVHRRFHWADDSPSFEQRVAGAADRPPADAKIRYGRALPRVAASRVTSNEIVPEMVRGRTVIVGPLARVGDLRFHVPSSPGASIDELEWRGQVARSLLASDWIRPPGNVASAVLILLATFLSVQVFRNVNAGWWPLCLAVASLMIVSATWLMLSLCSIQISCTAAIAVTFTTGFVVTRQRFRVLRSALDRRFSEANSNAIRVDSTGLSRDESIDVWQQAADAWFDLFAPTRVALLGLDGGDTYLSVRAMAGADESDIGERRRDITRMPYRDAVDQKTATRLTDEIFFTAEVAADAKSAGLERERTQFAIPLIAGKTIGVVTIEIESSRLAGWDAFGEQAMEFASEIATHLANQTDRAPSTTVRGTSLARAAGLPEQWMAASIVDSNSAAKAADDLWIRAFETAINPIAVCDPFGRVVQANSAMISTLQQCGQSLKEFDAIDWLQTVTGRSRRDCSNLVRRIVLQQREEKLFCKTDSGESLAPILIIRPLSREGEEQGGLGARSMSLELISPSVFTRASEWEQAFVKHQRDEISRRAKHCYEISTHNVSKCPVSAESDAPASSRASAADWTSVLDEIEGLVRLCQNQTDSLSDSPSLAAPLSLDEVLRQAIEDGRMVADSKGIGLKVERYQGLPAGYVNPFYLSDLFRTLVECVTADATAGETLVMRVGEFASQVVIDLSPAGVTPRFLGEDELRGSEETPLGDGWGSLPAEIADEIHQSVRHVRQWGGRLQVECSDDFRVSIRLGIRVEKAVDAAGGLLNEIDPRGGLESDGIGARR